MFILIRQTAFYADLSLVFLYLRNSPMIWGNELFLALRAGSRTPCSHAKKKTTSVNRLGFSGVDHARHEKYLYLIR